MSIRFSCSCGRKLKVSDEKIGMKVLCSTCGATLKVPKKSQDEYWQDAPTKSDEAKVDYVGALKEFVVNIVPGAVVIALMCWFAYFLSSQVLRGKGNLPPLGYVTGKVTMDGQPLVGATVRFVPTEPIYGEKSNGRQMGASVSLGVTDESGKYNLMYVKDVMGAFVGHHRVEIALKDSAGRERIPTEFNVKSTLQREVKSGSQEIDFDVHAIGSGTAATTSSAPAHP